MNGKLLKKDQVLIDRYQVTGWLGEGGMQEVYTAADLLLSRNVALKVPKDSAAEKRFRKSAIVSARVSHDNVAKTLDYFEADDRPYLIEELIDGCDISQLIATVVPYMPPQAVARVLHQLARGVGAAHNAGVVHRDLKPSNIMIVGAERLLQVKVTDFGIAKMAEEELKGWAEAGDKTATSSRTVLGAIPYMAPESILSFKTAGQPADVWALGAISYELLSGSKPFGQGLASIAAILSGKPPKSPWQISDPQFRTLGEELMGIIVSCLNPKVDERPSAKSLSSRCETLCYNNDPYERGNVKLVLNRYSGFLKTRQPRDAFYNRANFYGDSVIGDGDKVWFARHPGGGNDRAFPIVKAK